MAAGNSARRAAVITPQSQGQYAYQTSQTHKLVLHSIFAVTLVLNAAVCLVALLVFFRPFYFANDPETLVWASRLPTFASVIGNGVASLNSFALTLVIVSHAKTLVVNQGITIRKLQRLTTVANGSFPRDISSLALFAISTALAKAFVPSALVQALTPTATLEKYTGQMPYVSLSAASFPSSSSAGRPDIACEYGLTYGYGWQCPLNNRFGAIFDAGIQVFTDTVPVNYTRFGVTYPNSLSGISGAISSLSRAAYSQSVSPSASSSSSSNSRDGPSTSDVLRLCIPRMNISTTCSTSLRPGYIAGAQSRPLSLRQPSFITEFSINGSDYRDMNTFPDYGHGSLVIFGARYPQYNGMSSIFILSNKGYVTDLGSANIECNITGIEESIPIIIRGGGAVELDLSADAESTCNAQKMQQPDPEWLPNLTILSQMVLQKQQGQDGRLEALMLFRPNASVSRVDMIESAVTRMVSVAATEMYANLYDQLGNTSSTAQFRTLDFDYSTPRLALGNSTWPSLLFLIAPLFFTAILVAGWLYYAIYSEATLHFNPIDNTAMGIAGMNAMTVPQEVLEESVTDMDRISARCGHLRFRFGVPLQGNGAGVLGFYEDSADIAMPDKNLRYGSSSAVSNSLRYNGKTQNFGNAGGQNLHYVDPYKLSPQTSLVNTFPAGAYPLGTPHATGQNRPPSPHQYPQGSTAYNYLPVQPYQSY